MCIYICVYIYIYIYIYPSAARDDGCRAPLLSAEGGCSPASAGCHARRSLRHTCRILPPSEIDLGLCLQAQEGNIYFTELAERVEYDNYVRARVDRKKRLMPDGFLA